MRVREEEDLSILDQILAPKKFDDLVMQIQARDCRMFFPMVGVPRAYMEFPVPMVPLPEKTLARSVWGGNHDYNYERWVYKVFGWTAEGTRAKTESLLCEAVWKDFVGLRKQYAKLYGVDSDPLIVWRRMPEFEVRGKDFFERDGVNPVSYLHMRFHIPGLTLDAHPHCVKEAVPMSEQSSLKVFPEPRA